LKVSSGDEWCDEWVVAIQLVTFKKKVY